MGAGGIRASKQREGSHHYGRVRAPPDLHNCGLPAFRALELHFWVDAEFRIFEQMFCTAMNTGRFHGSKLAPFADGRGNRVTPC